MWSSDLCTSFLYFYTLTRWLMRMHELNALCMTRAGLVSCSESIHPVNPSNVNQKTGLNKTKGSKWTWVKLKHNLFQSLTRLFWCQTLTKQQPFWYRCHSPYDISVHVRAHNLIMRVGCATPRMILNPIIVIKKQLIPCQSNCNATICPTCSNSAAIHYEMVKSVHHHAVELWKPAEVFEVSELVQIKQ